MTLDVVMRRGRNWYAGFCIDCGKEIFIIPSQIETHSKRCASCSGKYNRVQSNIARTGISKYEFNHNFFNEGSLQADYWAGYIAADGYIDRQGRTLQLKLNERDRIALERFKQDLEYSGNVTYVKNGDTDQYRISITAAGKLCQALQDTYNIGNLKTFTLQPPNLVDKDRIRAYIVGYIDGDGTFGNTNTFKLSLCSSIYLCEWIKDHIDSLFPADDVARNISMKGKIPTYSVYGKRGVKIARYLKECPVWKLDRKWNKVP